ncbi:MAG TPA: hypothetical protein VL992_03955 [Tepidisphaeraceae bacterium]|nr:hypothetical protein [Tepidisphaeraceae bacterium]
MSTISFREFGLPPALLKAVEKRARSAGTTAREYVRLLIERDFLAEKSFDEILRPIRADFRRSGITEKQLDEIVQRARAHPRTKSARARR